MDLYDEYLAHTALLNKIGNLFNKDKTIKEYQNKVGSNYKYGGNVNPSSVSLDKSSSVISTSVNGVPCLQVKAKLHSPIFNRKFFFLNEKDRDSFMTKLSKRIYQIKSGGGR